MSTAAKPANPTVIGKLEPLPVEVTKDENNPGRFVIEIHKDARASLSLLESDIFTLSDQEGVTEEQIKEAEKGFVDLLNDMRQQFEQRINDPHPAVEHLGQLREYLNESENQISQALEVIHGPKYGPVELVDSVKKLKQERDAGKSACNSECTQLLSDLAAAFEHVYIDGYAPKDHLIFAPLLRRLALLEKK